MEVINPHSPCFSGCKYLKKCHADKSIVIECGRYEPTEEYKEFISKVKTIFPESLGESK
jgi:hypothetical protein